MNNIVISHLSRKYKNKIILNDVSLQIGNGVFGLFGRNGAGKSTLLRILAGILEQSSGEVSVNDTDIKNRDAIRNITGYLPQEFAFYPNFTVYDTLQYCAALSGMKNNTINDEIEKILIDLNLTEQGKKKFSKLSGGMKRRVGFAQTILHNPDILLFDEPFTGVDSVEKNRLFKLIEKLSNDKIIILSTHDVNDAEHLCNNIGVLNNGELAFCGNVSELKDMMNTDTLEKAYLNIVNGDKI